LKFVLLAQSGDLTITVLCGRFRISRKTGYKWIEHYRQNGQPALANRSRAPKQIHHRPTDEIEKVITAERRKQRLGSVQKFLRFIHCFIFLTSLMNQPA
jgi:transposase